MNYKTTYYGIYTGQLGFVLYKYLDITNWYL